MRATRDHLQADIEPHLKIQGTTVPRTIAYAFTASFLALGLTACSETTTQERNLSAVVSYYAEQKFPEYKYVFTDLNGDGVNDAIVLLQGRSWCGSGGCAMLVLKGEGEGYRVVSKSTATREAIRVSGSSSQGWRDIIVHSDGAEKLLQFDGIGYPSNPSMLSTAPQEQLDAAQIVLQ